MGRVLSVLLLSSLVSGSSFAFTDSLWVTEAGGYPGDLLTVEVWIEYEGGGPGDSISSFDIPLTWDAAVCTVETLVIGSDFAAWTDLSRIDNQGTQGPPAVAKLALSAFTFGPPIGPPQIPRGSYLAATVDFRILDSAIPPDSTRIDTLLEAFTPPVYLGFTDKNGINVYTPSFSPGHILVLEHLALLDGTPRNVDEREILSFDVRAIDSDPGHLITLEATYLPVGATFSPVSGYDSVRSTFTWRPDYCDAGADSAVFHAYCPTAEKYATTQIAIDDVNRGPTIDGGANRSVAPGTPLTFTVLAEDEDYEECGDDVLTLGALNLPGTATFIQDSDTSGVFDWTPVEADTGIHTVTFTVSDLDGASHSDDVRINVAYTLDSLMAIVRSYACPGLLEFAVPIVSVNFIELDRWEFTFGFDPAVMSIVGVDTAGTASAGAVSFRELAVVDSIPPESVFIFCRMPDEAPVPVGKNLLAYLLFAVDSGAVAPDTTVVDLLAGSHWPVLVDGHVPIETACCGDINGDGKIKVSDPIYLASFLYREGDPPVSDADVNLDGRVSVADANYLVTYLYRGGTPPCQPPYFGSRWWGQHLIDIEE